jgi:hypothetical protein
MTPFVNINKTQIAKYDMCGSLRPSMLAISHLGHVLILDMATFRFFVFKH